jgi:A/G-specific adenine glycosylase
LKSQTTAVKSFFSRKLLIWNKKHNNRSMPWKGEKDPYKIWLSEVILQQTRVEQGRAYYDRFVSTFPNVQKLAAAPETKVFKLWEGLGYYSRCKNLIATARYIVKENSGRFPERYEELLKLKGVGTYTAAAISSFAFNQPHAVLDGNVFRVLSRYFGIEKAIDGKEGKRIFKAYADELLDKKRPGVYNQAIMDFGAVCCKPKVPQCSACPLKGKCIAYANGWVNRLPLKSKGLARKSRWFYYFVVEYEGKVYVRKRQDKDIWENLFEFILMEKPGAKTRKELLALPLIKKILGKDLEAKPVFSKQYTRQLTHQVIHGQFIRISLNRPPASKGYEAIPVEKLKKLPFPVLIREYLAENPDRF